VRHVQARSHSHRRLETLDERRARGRAPRQGAQGARDRRVRDPALHAHRLRLRLALAQYRELANFARFGSDLDKSTPAQLTRGEKMVEILKQDEDVPLATERQVILIFCANEGLLDDLPTDSLKRFEQELFVFMDTKYPDVMHTLRDKKAFDKELEAEARKATGEFKAIFAKSVAAK
jgi:F-type H+-transporting ATPase subunit alpha